MAKLTTNLLIGIGLTGSIALNAAQAPLPPEAIKDPATYALLEHFRDFNRDPILGERISSAINTPNRLSTDELAATLHHIISARTLTPEQRANVFDYIVGVGRVTKPDFDLSARYTDQFGRQTSLLHAALLEGRPEIQRILIDRGAALDADTLAHERSQAARFGISERFVAPEMAAILRGEA